LVWHRSEFAVQRGDIYRGAIMLSPAAAAKRGGFILRPERIEFSPGRPSRLHDRFSYPRKRARPEF
jgi:pyridoxine/pyridoxamine 5'-phosphate oxidase